jgi:phage tail protein X
MPGIVISATIEADPSLAAFGLVLQAQALAVLLKFTL